MEKTLELMVGGGDIVAMVAMCRNVTDFCIKITMLLEIPYIYVYIHVLLFT